jgi:hypothetical protein
VIERSNVLLAVNFSDWMIPLVIAAVPAVASIVAAILAAGSARASRAAEIEATRLRELEDRLAERRYDTYQPMIDLLRRLMDSAKTSAKVSQQETTAQLSKFGAWISIFGSDDAVSAYHNFMQGAFHDAPTTVAMRLYADFLLAVRRDMGDSSSKTTQAHLLGMRINDLYDDPKFREVATLSFEDLCRRDNWEPPWPPS